MILDYEKINDSAKVYIYPSSRKFYTNEIEGLKNKIQAFLVLWSSDNLENISYKFLYNRFIVFFIENKEAPIKSSALDAIASFILSLETDYNVSLLDRMNVCFKQGKYIQYKELKDFKDLLKNKALTERSIVFDNLITTKAEFKSNWETTITNSWYNRFLKNKKA